MHKTDPTTTSAGLYRPDTEDIKRGDRVRANPISDRTYPIFDHSVDGTVVSVVMGTAPRLAIVWDGTPSRYCATGQECNSGLIDQDFADLSCDGFPFSVISLQGIEVEDAGTDEDADVPCESCRSSPASLKVGATPSWKLCQGCANLERWKRFGKRDLKTGSRVASSRGKRDRTQADTRSPEDSAKPSKVWIVTAKGHVFSVQGEGSKAAEDVDWLLGETGVDIEEGDIEVEEWVIGERIDLGEGEGPEVGP